jgi:hypothetical protein
MLWRSGNWIAGTATSLVFAFCGWLIAGNPGAALSAFVAFSIVMLWPFPARGEWDEPALPYLGAAAKPGGKHDPGEDL